MTAGETSRRGLIAGALSAAGAGALVAAGARSARAGSGRGRPVFDVAVVGAGLAGLSAATAIHRAGHAVIVLEARARVGGRNLDHPIGPGKVVELGGQWAGPGQDRVLALARRLGIDTFQTYSRGDSIYYAGGQSRTYRGGVPPAGGAAIAELAGAIAELNRLAATIPAGAPWAAPGAAQLDAQTVDAWLVGRLQTSQARELMRLSIRAVYGEEAHQISLLDLLQSIGGVGGDFNTLIGSAQSIRFVGGPQRLSERLAATLDVRLRTEVIAIEQSRLVTLNAIGASFRARRAIIALPKPLAGRLRFAPALPPGLDQLLQRQPMGSVVKVNAIYRRPFWRERGLSGNATSDTGPIRVTYDNSPPDGSPGVLVGFMEGDDSRAFYGRPAAQRRVAALRCFARYFGPEALTPIGYVDLSWAQERYTRGAYGSFNPPGVLTSLHDPLTGLPGVPHYASADASPLWPGHMDGAIRSGEAAARAAISAL